MDLDNVGVYADSKEIAIFTKRRVVRLLSVGYKPRSYS